MTPTQTHAALLSVHWYSIDKHGAATLCVDEDDAKATAIDSQTLYPHNGPYRAVQMAPIEPAQAGELPDEREAFEAWYATHASDVIGIDVTSDEIANCRVGDGYSEEGSYLNGAWAGYRAALAARKPLTMEQATALCICLTSQHVSVSQVQRRLAIGWNEAKDLCQSLVDSGLIGNIECSPQLNVNGIGLEVKT